MVEQIAIQDEQKHLARIEKQGPSMMNEIESEDQMCAEERQLYSEMHE